MDTWHPAEVNPLQSKLFFSLTLFPVPKMTKLCFFPRPFLCRQFSKMLKLKKDVSEKYFSELLKKATSDWSDRKEIIAIHKIFCHCGLIGRFLLPSWFIYHTSGLELEQTLPSTFWPMQSSFSDISVVCPRDGSRTTDTQEVTDVLRLSIPYCLSQSHWMPFLWVMLGCSYTRSNHSISIHLFRGMQT